MLTLDLLRHSLKLDHFFEIVQALFYLLKGRWPLPRSVQLCSVHRPYDEIVVANGLWIALPKGRSKPLF